MWYSIKSDDYVGVFDIVMPVSGRSSSEEGYIRQGNSTIEALGYFADIESKSGALVCVLVYITLNHIPISSEQKEPHSRTILLKQIYLFF